MAIKRMAVIGAGQMGTGIAQVAAQAGIDVVLADAAPELAKRSLDKLGATLAKLVEKGKFTAQERDGVLARIRPARAGPLERESPGARHTKLGAGTIATRNPGGPHFEAARHHHPRHRHGGAAGDLPCVNQLAATGSELDREVVASLSQDASFREQHDAQRPRRNRLNLGQVRGRGVAVASPLRPHEYGPDHEQRRHRQDSQRPTRRHQGS